MLVSQQLSDELPHAQNVVNRTDPVKVSLTTKQVTSEMFNSPPSQSLNTVLNKKMDFDTPSVDVDVFATTYLNQGVTLTVDLQNLIRLSAGASE